MAVGDEATSAGYPLVPESGEEGRVRWGSREINRTRDYVAQAKNLIPVGASAYRGSAGLRTGTGVPSNSLGSDGDWYARII